jgi:hypothetical protein
MRLSLAAEPALPVPPTEVSKAGKRRFAYWPGADEVGAPGFIRSLKVVRLSAKRSEAEEMLDLAPHNEREIRGEDEQAERDREEAKLREGALLLPLLPNPAAGPVKSVRALHRDRIRKRRLFGGVGAPRGLGHGPHSIRASLHFAA